MRQLIDLLNEKGPVDNEVDRACEDVPQRYTAGFEKALLNGVAPGKVL